MRRKAAKDVLLELPNKLYLTEPKDLHLRTSDRGLSYKALLEQKKQQEMKLSEEARKVKANPLPPKVVPFHPLPSTKSLTEFDEFHIRSINRHKEVLTEQQKEIQHMEELKHQQTTFHARPLPKTTYQCDFQVEKNERSPIKSMDISFESDVRALKRKEYDIQMQQRLEEKLLLKEMNEKKKIEDDNKRIREQRKLSTEQGGMAFIAKPVITKDLYPTKPMFSAALTEPKSPAFTKGANRRALQRQEIAAALQQL